ncbi:MAG TPA: hypothetical protein VM784_00255 [Actinomycetota bacterium]|nr:hypothetical protein [Actinomycetota bacterium]
MRRMRRTWIYLAVAIAATGIAIVQTSRLVAVQREQDRLRERAAGLEAELDERNEKADPSADLLGSLFEDGDDAPAALGGMLGGDTLDCVVGDTPLGAMLDAGEGRSARAQVRAIARSVEQVRGLEFERRVEPVFLPPDEVARRAVRLFLRDYPEETADAEARLLRSLGAIPPDLDLRAAVEELLESQVAGFYVPKTQELVVPSDDPSEPLTAAEKIILAHELDHALTDQALGLPIPGNPDPARLDEDLAAIALVEGDATLAMQRYALSDIPIFEQLSMLSDPLVTGSQAALEGTPYYLAQQLQFPYLAGLGFVCARYDDGKWKSVDRAYARPPAASDQVLFPERYGEGKPTPPRAPGAPGRGWDRVWSSSFGAAHLLWLFEAPGGDESAALTGAEDAVAAWGGGRAVVWADGDDSAVGLALVERAEEDGLCDAVARWYEAAFPDDDDVPPAPGERFVRDGASQDAVLRCAGDDVRLGIATGIDAARRIAD